MPKFSKTIGQLHFEDLEPHKFEDLVRGLLYDFRDWQSIEATGRKGGDDGFDARAWEKVKVIENEDEEDKSKGEHPMEGNLWMIQCKREKEIGPKRIKEILKDVDSKTPPYGYILAASTDFSKKSYDTFREELLNKGVSEFYLWGKAQLEDMLYMPKNDHILFATFGISFNTKRRSKRTEIKFILNNKNKIFRILGGGRTNSMNYEPILVRDFNDENYPYKGEYKDFDKNPRWEEYLPFEYHTSGIWVHVKQFYAYLNSKKKQFDLYDKADLLNRRSEIRMGRVNQDFGEKASDFWEHLPIRNQAKLYIDGLIYFKDMLVIDEKGDYLYGFPHIFLEYNYRKNRPFGGYRYTFRTNSEELSLENDFKRVKVFPDKFTKHKIGKVIKTPLNIPYRTIQPYYLHDRETVSRNGRIYDLDNKYNSLKIGDVLNVKDDIGSNSGQPENYYLEITNKYETKVKNFLTENGTFPYNDLIKTQAGRDIRESEAMTVLEVTHVSKQDVEGKSK